MRHELRDALRALRRAPVFAVVAIAMLALAIGSTTSVFSVIDAVLLRGLPYRSPGRIQAIYERNETGGLRTPSFPTFRDWQTQSADARDVIEGFAFVRGDGVSIPGADGPERQIAAYVTPGFFELLGTSAAIGRIFRPDEERPGAPRVAVISHDFFVRHYGGDRSVLGKTLAVDSIPTTIIGVMPRGFAYPNFGSGGWLAPTLWQPIAVFQSTHQALSLRGLHADSRTILRLRPGADSARAAAAMRTIAQRLASEYPIEQGHWTMVELHPISEEMFGQLSSNLLLVAGAVGLVLLLACANVANLLLVRSSIRGRELAIRAALGANGWRLARHLLTEAAVIAGIAGAVGVSLAFAIVRFLRQYAGQRLPFSTDIAVDARAMAAALGLSILTALLVGVLPVLHAARGDLISRLRSGGATGDDGGVAQRRARDILVAVQFALAITVLVGAGLLVQSVRRVAAVALGYDADGLVWFSVSPSKSKYGEPAQAAALYQRILTALNALPSVEQVAAAGGALLPTKVETDDQRGSDARVEARYHPVSPEYFKLLGLRVVEGRAFSDEDIRSPNGFVITENLAKQLWPNRSALGQRITVRRSSQARADFGQPITLPVVGVVADYREFGPEQPPPPQVLLPFTLEVWPWMNFVVRSPRPTLILSAVTDAVRGVEPAIEFLAKPAASGNRYGGFGDPRVFLTTLLSGFATVSLLLAAIGLYGIVAYGVAQRSRELGIRIAVGATRNAILTLILGHAARLVIGGVAAGLLAAAAATKVLRAMLFQTSTTDAVTFVVVPVVLAVVATIASLAPAFRATRTDPLIVIRAE